MTLLVHGVLLTLFIHFGNRSTRREQKAELQFVSLWPDTRAVPPATSSTPEQARTPKTGTDNSMRATATNPATVEESLAPETSEPVAPTDAGARIDWYGEAAKAATAGGEPARAKRDFLEPPKKLREPCKPTASSWEWNSEEPKAGLLPLPYIVLADRCFITLGFFSCVLGELPPPNSHLLDDMKGRDMASSVPSPQFCD